MLEAAEMDFWQSATGRSTLERVTNELIREIMEVMHIIVDEIKNRQLIWYGHVERMPETMFPSQGINWKPPGRRKPGRPRRNWQQHMDKIMRERNLRNDMWRIRLKCRAGIGRHVTLRID